MRTYAEVYVERDVHVVKTKVAEHRGDDDGTSPIRNQVVKVNFHEKLPENDIMGVLLSDLLKGGGDTSELLENNPIQFLAVQVWRPSGRPQGLIHLYVPPTGRFLVPLKSLWFNLRGRDGEEEVVMVETAAESREGGAKE
ncbi:hypothetical protein RND71_033691 [Anisodus tanguticus]|uniref:Uncharacterized protein n=1 Tax=Anisodus tanguticus TaxID=243964 RepID=A0AAE1RAN8_9SOLA|nr:hypothetical protein RND71_033691 [Anisodus tanguticus]